LFFRHRHALGRVVKVTTKNTKNTNIHMGEQVA